MMGISWRTGPRLPLRLAWWILRALLRPLYAGLLRPLCVGLLRPLCAGLSWLTLSTVLPLEASVVFNEDPSIPTKRRWSTVPKKVSQRRAD